MFNMMRKIAGFCQWGVSKVYNYCKSRHLVIHFSKFPLKRHDFCTIACFAVKSVLINMLIVAVLFLFGKQGRENQRSATQCLFVLRTNCICFTRVACRNQLIMEQKCWQEDLVSDQY